MTLLILAAGMGSRFGGLKQIEPMGPNNEFIIDYSVYDAKRAGFDKIVFVIKKDMYDDFKNTIGKRVEGHIDVEYVFQEMRDIPIGISYERLKPWGTGHAIYAARDVIDDNFAIINADDFYGRDAFVKAHDVLNELKDNEFGMIAYRAGNTLTENGSVKRGVCVLDGDTLTGIEESCIEKIGDKIHCESLIDNHEYDIELSRLVSMNLLLFTPKIFEYLKNDLVYFLKNMTDRGKDEFLIPEVINNHIKSGDITVRVVETSSVWYGVTYKEDTDTVKRAILNMIDNGEYNKTLW